MGAAEVIPGISGGTIALILGVYERLINAISSFDYDLILLLKEKKMSLSWVRVDGNFLCILFIGMLLSIYSLSSIILYLMNAYPLAFKSFLSSLLFCSVFIDPLKPKISRAFFFGLTIAFIICSLIYLIPGKDLNEITSLYLFFSGFLEIIALVVPGISGSFILLLLGTYSYVLNAVKDLNMELLLIFISGAIIGLLSSVRVVKILYEKQRTLLLSIFFGLILFCIPLIWQEQTIELFDKGNLQSIFIGGFMGAVIILSFEKLNQN